MGSVCYIFHQPINTDQGEAVDVKGCPCDRVVINMLNIGKHHRGIEKIVFTPLVYQEGLKTYRIEYNLWASFAVS